MNWRALEFIPLFSDARILPNVFHASRRKSLLEEGIGLASRA
jgi:hypothetical protein